VIGEDRIESDLVLLIFGVDGIADGVFLEDFLVSAVVNGV
jgi:hypothetical protein